MKFIHDSVNSKEKLIINRDSSSCNNPLRNFEMRNNLSFENRSGSVIKLNVFQKIKSCRCCNCYLLLRQEPWICSCQKQSQEIFSLTFYRHLCLTSNFFFMFSIVQLNSLTCNTIEIASWKYTQLNIILNT